MGNLRVSQHQGIIIKKSSIKERNISLSKILKVMEVDRPLDENEELLSFGPHFGKEAANEFIRRLKELDLIYVDDFIDFAVDIPDWCEVFVALKRA